MHFFFKRDRGFYRVWLKGWQSDYFEAVTPEEFVPFQQTAKRFGATFTEVED